MAVENQDGKYLDAILLQLGDFGRYQIYLVVLLALPLSLAGSMQLSYVFSALNIKYRCEILDCDPKSNPEFKPNWLKQAIPFNKENEPKNCAKYPNITNINNCSNEKFDNNFEEGCETYVYQSQEVTVAHEFNLQCDQNLWKLTIIGTINNVGELVGTPFVGHASDRYGRKAVLLWAIFLCTIAGIAKAFATTYAWFLVFEFVSALFAGPAYCVGLVYCIELVAPQTRVLAGTIVNVYYTMGEVLLAFLAWLTMTWRVLLLVVNVPASVCLLYYWILPESVRWLLTQGRNEEAFRILRKTASVNGIEISEESLEQLITVGPKKVESNKYIMEAIKSRCLMFRLCLCIICWIIGALLFYGLTLNSVSLTGNPYVSFILAALVEIPGILLVNFLVDAIGRRYCQCGAFWLTSAASLVYLCFNAESKWFRLIAYLLAKFGATSALSVCYFLATELFPTCLRQSLLGWCICIGRIGSMIAPQVPLLAKIWPPLPMVLYAVLGFIAGILTLLLPETTKIKLPDTIVEAVHIGMKPKENSEAFSYNTFNSETK